MRAISTAPVGGGCGTGTATVAEVAEATTALFVSISDDTCYPQPGKQHGGEKHRCAQCVYSHSMLEGCYMHRTFTGIVYCGCVD